VTKSSVAAAAASVFDDEDCDGEGGPEEDLNTFTAEELDASLVRLLGREGADKAKAAHAKMLEARKASAKAASLARSRARARELYYGGVGGVGRRPAGAAASAPGACRPKGSSLARGNLYGGGSLLS
jgi:hypothetical protein